MKIVFWGSSDFSLPSLEALNEHHEVVGVVTNPDKPYGRGNKKIHMTPMKYCAMQNDMFCMQPKTVKDPDFINHLEASDADLFVVVSFGRIIPENIIYMPKHNTINLHASLLPKYRGASPIHAALLNDDVLTGNTVQFINARMDEGGVLMQSEVPIQSDDKFPDLYDRLAQNGVQLLLDSIKLIESGNAVPIPQDDNEASYAHIIHKEDGRVDFIQKSAREIYNKWRAYYVWPGIYTPFYNQAQRPEPSLHKKSMKQPLISFTKISVNDTINGEPGQIVQANKNGLFVACREGSIQIEMVKPSGKKEMDFKAFVNGYRPIQGRYF